MTSIQRRTLKANGNYQLLLKVKGSSWLAQHCNKLYDDHNHEMLKRYLRVKCDELRPYVIYNADMSTPERVDTNVYKVVVANYELKKS